MKIGPTPRWIALTTAALVVLVAGGALLWPRKVRDPRDAFLACAEAVAAKESRAPCEQLSPRERFTAETLARCLVEARRLGRREAEACPSLHWPKRP